MCDIYHCFGFTFSTTNSRCFSLLIIIWSITTFTLSLTTFTIVLVLHFAQQIAGVFPPRYSWYITTFTLSVFDIYHCLFTLRTTNRTCFSLFIITWLRFTTFTLSLIYHCFGFISHNKQDVFLLPHYKVVYYHIYTFCLQHLPLFRFYISHNK